MSDKDKIEEILKFIRYKKEIGEKVSMKLVITKCKENKISYPKVIKEIYKNNLMEVME